MAIFHYIAKDKEARSASGSAQAKDAVSLARELKNKGLTIISIVEEKEKSQIEKKIRNVGGSPVKQADLVVFSRLLATLIDSGIPLVNGLGILYEQVENKYLKKVVSELRVDIESGNSLSASFAKHPETFPAIFINMIRAGETSGSLNVILERLSDYTERSEKMKSKLSTAMVYPAIVIFMAIGIMAFLILKVVPAFKGIFKNLGGELPIPTQVLIFISDNSIKLFPIIIGGIILLYIGFIKYINSEKGRLWFDGFKLKIPVFGGLIAKVIVSRFASTLAILFKSGVNILEAFDIVSKVLGNRVFEIATEQIKKRLQSGESISEPMLQTKRFPPFVARMIAVGEQTGDLEKMLNKISEYYESQVNEALAGISSIIEPIIISFLGFAVGFIVLAMFLPIFKLTQMVGQ